MGFEFRVRFDDPAFYPANRARILEFARRLPHVVPLVEVGSSVAWRATDSEIWLRAGAPTDDHEDWPYDARLFVRDELLVEVSRFSDAYFVDARTLVEWLDGQTRAALVDDDGAAVRWPERPR